jgi:hypothetical protein
VIGVPICVRRLHSQADLVADVRVALQKERGQEQSDEAKKCYESPIVPVADLKTSVPASKANTALLAHPHFVTLPLACPTGALQSSAISCPSPRLTSSPAH